MAQRLGRGIVLLFHDRGTRKGEWSAARPGRTLPPGKTRYPFYRRLSGPQGRSGRAKNLVPTGIRSRTVQPVVSRYTDWATRPTSSGCYPLLTVLKMKETIFSNRHGVVFRNTWTLNGKERNMPCNIDNNCKRRCGCQPSWVPSYANPKPHKWFTHRRTNLQPVAHSLGWCYSMIVCRRCECVRNERERRCNMRCT